MEKPCTAPLFLRNLLTSIFIHADKSLLHLAPKYALLQILRSILASFFLFSLSLLPSLFSPLTPDRKESANYPPKSAKGDLYASAAVGDFGVSRALSQLLLIMSEIPVSSRKYEVVRLLTENLIDENLSEGSQVLREVNCAVLSSAFTRSLRQIEAAAAAEQGQSGGGDCARDEIFICSNNRASRLIKGVGYYGRAAWRYANSRGVVGGPGISAEKLAAELLWLARKMAACGCEEEAICMWASASNLAGLALSAEARLQGSLVKISAFLIKQAKEMKDNKKDGTKTSKPPKPDLTNETKIKLLMTWLPLLCRASSGTDTPVLSMGERTELEMTLEEIISSLGEQEEQECVLSVWVHHFTRCPASDWPNLRQCYSRWYGSSRARLVQASAA
ncbi:ILI1 binding bHLH 1 [Striga asiatica]|uniref:ILI1 binding bHLH 1 n=1 Tax=Striga asiatica TaxID=4170 RepID=A0A5A7RES5_STRAF|nr:ILI1 binding bHLH 1 [Striga asiatica]